MRTHKLTYIEVTTPDGVVYRETGLDSYGTVDIEIVKGLRIDNLIWGLTIAEQNGDIWQPSGYGRVARRTVKHRRKLYTVEYGEVPADAFTYREYVAARAAGDTSAETRYYLQFADAVRLNYNIDLAPFKNSNDPNFSDVSFWVWRSLWDSPARAALQSVARSLGEGSHSGFLGVAEVQTLFTVIIRERLAAAKLEVHTDKPEMTPKEMLERLNAGPMEHAEFTVLRREFYRTFITPAVMRAVADLPPMTSPQEKPAQDWIDLTRSNPAIARSVRAAYKKAGVPAPVLGDICWVLMEAAKLRNDVTKVIDAVLEHIFTQTGVVTVACDYFVGVHENQKGTYVNLLLSERARESDALDKIKRLCEYSRLISRAEPNGVRRIAVFLRPERMTECGI